MSSCKYETYLVDYLDIQINPSQYTKIQNHIKICPSCSEKFSTFNHTWSLLKNRKRTDPPVHILNEYEAFLDSEFPQQRFLFIIRNRIRLYMDSIFEKRLPRFELVRLAIVLSIGIVIGTFISNRSEHKDVQPYQLFSSLSSTEIVEMENFFLLSEIWLITFGNAISNKEAMDFYLTFNKEFSQDILENTSFMYRQAENLKSPSLIEFLNHLESLIVGLSTAQPKDKWSIFNKNRKIIIETGLFFEALKWRNLLQFQEKRLEANSELTKT
jgi:hypothetical protein